MLNHDFSPTLEQFPLYITQNSFHSQDLECIPPPFSSTSPLTFPLAPVTFSKSTRIKLWKYFSFLYLSLFLFATINHSFFLLNVIYIIFSPPPPLPSSNFYSLEALFTSFSQPSLISKLFISVSFSLLTT